MSDRIRVEVVGVGWGTVVIVPAFRAVPEFEVVATPTDLHRDQVLAAVATGRGEPAIDPEPGAQRFPWPAPGVPTLYDGLVTSSVVEAAQRSTAGEGWIPLDLSPCNATLHGG